MPGAAGRTPGIRRSPHPRPTGPPRARSGGRFRSRRARSRSLRGGRGRQQVGLVQPEREVEHIVIVQGRAVVLLENLGWYVPRLRNDAARDQQRHDVTTGGLAHLVVTGRAHEGVVRPTLHGADDETNLVWREFYIATTWAGRLDRRHMPRHLQQSHHSPSTSSSVALRNSLSTNSKP